MQTNIHRVKSIAVSEITKLSQQSDASTYTRDITIVFMVGGKECEYELTMFTEDKYLSAEEAMAVLAVKL